MVLFNHATREMTAKIVYYGPGLCGKTTNLLVIYDKLDDSKRGKMLSLATKTDRTLFFDLLPVDIGKVGPFNLKIQLYTVPGQVFYNETRKLVLKGADAVVFVVDSQPSMVESNRGSFENLFDNLKVNNLDPNDMPIVIQYNKRDIPGVLPVEQLQESLGLEGFPYKEASALQGDGVMETFRLVSRLTAKHLVGKLAGKPGSRPDRAREERKIKVRTAAPPAETEAMAPPPDFSGPAMPLNAPDNPFASSMPFASSAAATATAVEEPEPPVAPFESAGPEEEYENVEEVSLEQLLEGRERPATFAGNVALPVLLDNPMEPMNEDLDLQPAEEVEEIEELAEVVEEPQAEVAIEAETYSGDTPVVEVEPERETPFEEAAPEPVVAEATEESPSAVDAMILRDLQEQIDALRSELHELKEQHERVVKAIAESATQLTKLNR